jgi:hypothetical protein
MAAVRITRADSGLEPPDGLLTAHSWPIERLLCTYSPLLRGGISAVVLRILRALLTIALLHVAQGESDEKAERGYETC